MPLKMRSIPRIIPITAAPVKKFFHIMKASTTPSTPDSSIHSEPPMAFTRKYSIIFVIPSTRK